MLRLRFPALQIALKCPFVRTKSNPNGECSISTFTNYRPWWVKDPNLADGLCHHCQKRRDFIKYIHMIFPKTNPEFKCDDSEENSG